jgi:hypothetical protein
MELQALRGLSATVSRNRCPMLVEVEPRTRRYFDKITVEWRYESSSPTVLNGSNANPWVTSAMGRKQTLLTSEPE